MDYQTLTTIIIRNIGLVAFMIAIVGRVIVNVIMLVVFKQYDTIVIDHRQM